MIDCCKTVDTILVQFYLRDSLFLLFFFFQENDLPFFPTIFLQKQIIINKLLRRQS
jgi:hypothetical protein